MDRKLYGLRSGGNTLNGVPAQAIGEELERIRIEHDGRLETEAVLENARTPQSPLYPLFDWNNKTAAEKWRLHQARNLIRSITIIGPDEEPEPAFFHVKITGSKQYYQSAEEVVNRIDEYASAVQELQGKVIGAMKALEALRKKVQVRSDKESLSLLSVAMESLGTAREAISKVVTH